MHCLNIKNQNNKMKFNNDSTITMEHNTFIQLASKLSYITNIVDRYDDYVTNKYITLRVKWFTKAWGFILGIKKLNLEKK